MSLNIGSIKFYGNTLWHNGNTEKKIKGKIMSSKEKRLKTKFIQIRVTPKDYEIYSEYAKKKKISKTELFNLFMELIKKEKI